LERGAADKQAVAQKDVKLRPAAGEMATIDLGQKVGLLGKKLVEL
jgi:hypothetical protein